MKYDEAKEFARIERLASSGRSETAQGANSTSDTLVVGAERTPQLLDADPLQPTEPFNVERALREEYWLHHGCGGFSALYGDDGEMQCRACGHDFKRESIEALAGFVAMNRVVRARERLGKFVQSVERLEQVVKQEQGVRS